MKQFLAFAAGSLCLLLTGCSKRSMVEASYNVIPLPKSVTAGTGEGFTLTPATVLAYPAGNDTLRRNAELMAEYLKPLIEADIKVTDDTASKDAIVLLSNLKAENPEAYTVNVAPGRITVNGATAAGNFYGLQTVRKAIPSAGKHNVTFPAAEISDFPRFPYRGCHLDVARHFFPIDSVKMFIDLIALHNGNRFHWHLTEDQGWRLESKKYPKLTEIGSKRSGTCIGHDFSTNDSVPYGGFYTQDEAREIVKYAAERHITVIPEIDLPGHMLGALASYPEMGCTGGPYEVWTRWGVSDDVLCAGNDTTYTFIADILNELADIFPSEYIHIGGDESPKVRWEACPKCQAKISELGLKSDDHSTKEQKLQTHVMSFASDVLAKRGRKIIGWEEMMEGGLPEGASVMAWLGEGSGLKAAKMGHDAIMTPLQYCYFDYYQALDKENEPDAIGGYLPIQNVYNYEPIPASFTPEEAAHIKGVQSNLWTEYIPTFSQALYMELPRLAALCEVQWLDPSQKDFSNFSRRLPQLINHYEVLGANYAKHVFNVTGKIAADTTAHVVKATYTTLDDAPVHYTLDGTDPTEQSPLYKEPVSITEKAVIKAAAFRNGKPSKIVTDTVVPSLSTARPIKIEGNVHPKYNAPAEVLVDGIAGPATFNTGSWIGFYQSPMVATIDLGTPTKVSSVTAHTMFETGSWIFPAESMTVAVSADGKTFTEVAAQKYPLPTAHESGLRNFTLTFLGVEARYVKVTLGCVMAMPDWHPGKGAPSFVFVDELTIN